MTLASIGSAAAVVLTMAALPTGSAAQGQDPDARTLAAYRLSEATLTRFVAASKNLAAAAQVGRDTLGEGDEDDAGPETIADIAAFYDRHPPLRQAIVGAGLTSREYVIFMLTLFQAGMAAWLVEQHGWDRLPAEIARENVVFYQRHKARLDSLTADLKEREERDPPQQ